MTEPIRPVAFGERAGKEPYNASEIVALDDSRFLFCDNNIGDALFELRLRSDASMVGPLVRRPVEGLEPGAVDDLECMARADDGSRTLVYACPSLSRKIRDAGHKKKRKRGKDAPERGVLVRIEIGPDERLRAETFPGFREWLVERTPELGKAADWIPDDGGLNLEGLAWDPSARLLLFGLRTPVADGRPMVLRARVASHDVPLGAECLELLPPVALAVEDAGDEQGIRTIEYDASRGVSLVVVGNATSSSKAPFSLYSWDGNEEGAVELFEAVRFEDSMRVEGVTRGTVGGRGAVVFVDDRGAYAVVWDDDSRLRR